MDEQKQIVMIPVPVMSLERFAELTGLSESRVRSMIEKGHLPSMKCGKPCMVRIARPPTSYQPGRLGMSRRKQSVRLSLDADEYREVLKQTADTD